MAEASANRDLRLTLQPDGSASMHATTVSVDGRALVICGSSGSGKSGLAAQMIALGAGLVVDDLTRLVSEDGTLMAKAPTNVAPRLELRGLGLVRVPVAGPTPVAACLSLTPSKARLPDAETTDILGHIIPLLRHPTSPDLAAKLFLWLRAQQDGGTAP